MSKAASGLRVHPTAQRYLFTVCRFNDHPRDKSLVLVVDYRVWGQNTIGYIGLRLSDGKPVYAPYTPTISRTKRSTSKARRAYKRFLNNVIDESFKAASNKRKC